MTGSVERERLFGGTWSILAFQGDSLKYFLKANRKKLLFI